MKDNTPLKENELYRITRDDEHHYFTSLYRAALFIGKQRAQVEYAFLKGKQVNDWTVDIVDGSNIEYKYIY